MPHAIRIHSTGGPEVLQWEQVPMPEPAEGEVVIKHTAVGLNFIDTYYRNGTYKAPTLPFTPGFEGCGVVIRPGKNTRFVKVGDRVAYAMGPMGAYSQFRTIPEPFLVKVPNAVADAQVAASLLRGLTAHFLLRRTYVVHEDAIVLVHAAAGGLGSLVCQWARHLGATVIGTVGSDEKKPMATEFGCHHVFNYRTENIGQAVKDVTNGMGAHVVYDGVGKDTFDHSLNAIARFGTFVSVGQASGPVPPVELSTLRDRGSIFMTRPTLFDYKQDRDEYYLGAAEVFQMILKRQLRLHIMQSYQLEDAATAHRELEAGQTKGPSVLLVGKAKH